MVSKSNLNLFILEAYTPSMKLKSIIYAIIAFVLPWLIILGGATAKIYNMWLYVIPITWFVMAAFIFLSLYKF